MKKTLLAAALLAGFATAGVAQAETSVTLYGIIDTGYGFQNYKYDKGDIDFKSRSSGIRSDGVNGNRFGVRGSEDLGDGLRAIFTLEQGFNPGNGQQIGNRAWHRQTFVGLSSDAWGTFTMGRQYSTGSAFGVYQGPNGIFLGDNEKTFGGLGAGNRVDNSFKYVSPNFAGFQVQALYGTPDIDIVRYSDNGVLVGESERSNWASIGVSYVNGPLGLSAAYDRLSTDSDKAIQNWHVAGSYDFEVVKLGLAYGQDRQGKLPGWAGKHGLMGELAGKDFETTAGAYQFENGFKSNNYAIGLTAPLGAGTGYLGYSRSAPNNKDVADNKLYERKATNVYHANYQYPLSKRTLVYAYASYTQNFAYIDGLKGTEAGIGFNHKF